MTSRMIIIFAITLLLPYNAMAQDTSDWRVPIKTDFANESEWRQNDKMLYLTAKADFDGDGKQDTARLLINDKKSKMGLFAELSSKPGKIQLVEDDKTRIQVMGITVAKTGKHKTACGKGYWACKKGEPATLNLTLPAIDYFREESASSFFIWNKKAKQFERVWMSD